MKYFAHAVIFALFLSVPLFAQSASSQASARRASAARDSFPSIDDMVSSLSGGEGKEFSLADSITEMISSMGTDTVTENTEETVRSAVEGRLVVEEVIPDVNREVVEAIDARTRRYSPRLKIDFKEFPLRRVARTGSPDRAERVAQRLRDRLRVEELGVVLDDRFARLTGIVDTPRQRELAEMMIRLEPGVDEVRNELLIAP